jgi:hypothetical protein
MTLSRRDVFARGGALGIGMGAAGMPFATESLAAPLRQEGNNLVIFVTHDDNPFFVPVRAGFEQFGELAGWQTQWVGPPSHDEVATLQYQLDAIAAGPAAVGFTRVNTEQFDDAIRSAQEEGIFVILFNTASDGYQDLGVAYVGQEFIPPESSAGSTRRSTPRRSPAATTASSSWARSPPATARSTRGWRGRGKGLPNTTKRTARRTRPKT